MSGRNLLFIKRFAGNAFKNPLIIILDTGFTGMGVNLQTATFISLEYVQIRGYLARMSSTDMDKSEITPGPESLFGKR